MGLRIDAALPELREAFGQLSDYAKSLGMTIHVLGTGGVRTEADTALYKSYRAAEYALAVAKNPATAKIPIGQWRPIANFGSSFHNYGAAFDIGFGSGTLGGPGYVSEKDGLYGFTTDFALESLGEYAKTIGLRWGGNFKASQTSGPDPVHFELDITLAEAKARWAATGPHSPAGFATWSALAIAFGFGILILILRKFS